MGLHSVYAGAVVVRRRFGGWAYLLVRSPRGWQFFSVERCDDEGLPEAARRYAWEVARISGLRFYWGHQHFSLTTANGQVTQFLIAESGSGEACLDDSWLEHRWVAAATAAELLPQSTRPVLDWADGVLTGADGTPGVKR